MADKSICPECGGRLAVAVFEAFYLTKDGKKSKRRVSAFKATPRSIRNTVICTKCCEVFK